MKEQMLLFYVNNENSTYFFVINKLYLQLNPHFAVVRPNSSSNHYTIVAATIVAILVKITCI